jgi:integrase
VPIVSLADATIRSLKPSDTQITYWDKGLKNFGLRVNPGGSMTWILLVGHDRQRIKLGNYPTISLKTARELAREKLPEITLGHHRPRTKTFGEAYETFEERHFPKLHPKTVYELKRIIRKHFLPKLGKKQLVDLEPHDITDITDKLSRGTAWHAHAAVGTFLNWCVPRYIKVSPMTGLEKPDSTPGPTPLPGKDDFRAILKLALAREKDTYSQIVALLCLIGQRRGETAAIRRSWIQGDLLTIPGEFTKNKKETIIPLPGLAQDVIAKIPNLGAPSFRPSEAMYGAIRPPPLTVGRKPKMSLTNGYL